MDTVQGGKCLVAWKRVTRSVELDGLRVLNLTTLGYALYSRWEWLARTDALGRHSKPIKTCCLCHV
jgi:hypothetical protein